MPRITAAANPDRTRLVPKVFMVKVTTVISSSLVEGIAPGGGKVVVSVPAFVAPALLLGRLINVVELEGTTQLIARGKLPCPGGPIPDLLIGLNGNLYIFDGITAPRLISGLPSEWGYSTLGLFMDNDATFLLLSHQVSLPGFAIRVKKLNLQTGGWTFTGTSFFDASSGFADEIQSFIQSSIDGHIYALAHYNDRCCLLRYVVGTDTWSIVYQAANQDLLPALGLCEGQDGKIYFTEQWYGVGPGPASVRTFDPTTGINAVDLDILTTFPNAKWAFSMPLIQAWDRIILGASSAINDVSIDIIFEKVGGNWSKTYTWTGPSGALNGLLVFCAVGVTQDVPNPTELLAIIDEIVSGFPTYQRRIRVLSKTSSGGGWIEQTNFIIAPGDNLHVQAAQELGGRPYFIYGTREVLSTAIYRREDDIVTWTKLYEMESAFSTLVLSEGSVMIRTFANLSRT